ncbi:polyamine-transporting ATPase 13A2-like [Macrobrachium rosenbergii]|uniref:polyamine-transporting ATPase 13A2-like n=1 Tax=Macrobrachium rosenbergii TaxID=79674 RepID=UPI0034D3ABB7
MTHRKIDLRPTMTNMTYDRLDEEIGAEDSGPPNHKQVLHLGTAEELTLHGYQLSSWKAFSYYLISVITLGCPLLFSYWKPEWGVYWKRRKCPLSHADTLIIKDADGQLIVVPLENEEVDTNFDPQYAVTSHFANVAADGLQNGATDSTHLTEPVKKFMRYFVYQHIRYLWMPYKKTFVCLRGYDNNTCISSLLTDFRGFSLEEQMQRQQLYGRNVISVEVKSYVNLLVTEILNPFYIFQIASIVLWSFDNYILYASCIFFVSCLSVAVSLFETRKQSQSLHDMIEASNTSEVNVLRMTSEKTTVEAQTSTVDLVPGDVVVIPPNGCIMACDAVLISGNAIVNESMLTGESVPVTKTPVTASEEKEIYCAEKHKRHTLFCGTEVIQTRYYGTAQVLAVVVRTGFSTAKGELVRSILYPRPLDFKFYKDSMKFIGFMFLIATIGMSYSVYVYIMHKVSENCEAVIKTIVKPDIVTIVNLPALPAAMTVGTYYAQSRLRKKGIFCISPPRINVSGKLKLVCFDKHYPEESLCLLAGVRIWAGSMGHSKPTSFFHQPTSGTFLVAIEGFCAGQSMPGRGEGVVGGGVCYFGSQTIGEGIPQDGGEVRTPVVGNDLGNAVPSVTQLSAVCCRMGIASGHLVFLSLIVNRYLYPSDEGDVGEGMETFLHGLCLLPSNKLMPLWNSGHMELVAGLCFIRYLASPALVYLVMVAPIESSTLSLMTANSFGCLGSRLPVLTTQHLQGYLYVPIMFDLFLLVLGKAYYPHGSVGICDDTFNLLEWLGKPNQAMEEPSDEDTQRFDNLIPTIVRPPTATFPTSPHPPNPVPSAISSQNSLQALAHPSSLVTAENSQAYTSSSQSNSLSLILNVQSQPLAISPSVAIPSSLPLYPSSCPVSHNSMSSFTQPFCHSYHSLLFSLPSSHPPQAPPCSPSNVHSMPHATDTVCTPLESTASVLHLHTSDGEGPTQSESTDTSTTQDAHFVEQTMEEASLGSSNYDQVAPAVVRPCIKESYIDPPDIANVVETAMQVPYEIGIVRQFPFSSNSQRMSVIVRVLGQQYMDLYVKGAPEVIQTLCSPETLPEDLGSILTQYTVQGFRVIALAHRTLDTKLSWHAAQRIPRDQVEKELTFIGLLILQNMLKPETTPVIHQLKAANIRSVMVTGDNILTAISVARDCGMVDVADSVLMAKVTSPASGQAPTLTFEPADTPDILVQHADRTDNGDIAVQLDSHKARYHLAVTGKAWGLICQYFPDLVPRIVAKGTVFARMSPDQKAQLVEELQAIDYIVGMCGDGANDCGALKAAHVGISLSEAEASVAAPFTSHTNNIECVPRVVCEGRCALTTNFSVFKYMALYSIIQFVSVLILYTAYSNLTDPEFLYIDLFIVTVVAVFMGYTGATNKLVPEKPLGNLLGAVNLFSVVSQILLVVLAQVAAYYYLQQQPWFVPNKPTPSEESDNTKSWETAAIFYTSSFQYLTLCFVFSPGYPFRKPIYTNVWLTISLLSLTVTSLLMLMCPWPWLMNFMQIKSDPDDLLIAFRVTLLLIVCTHFVLSLSVEYFLASSRFLKKFFQWITCKRAPKNKYKHVLQEMEEDCSWPPIGTVLYGSHET